MLREKYHFISLTNLLLLYKVKEEIYINMDDHPQVPKIQYILML